MGLSHYVYPGALHTRFHHALGSLHLMTQAIQVLREKGVSISEKESEGVSIAILLHDIGHGPFSHALEKVFIDLSHEKLSLGIMEELNIEFSGKLDLAVEIFKNNYHRRFLNQLVSSQLDMDRMDYLNRDSFFTGVAEGVIAYDRIIKMLNVRENELLIEEKGIYSIEKFLLSRKLMYWQVYLHKTSIIAEQMLLQFIKLLKIDLQKNHHNLCSDSLSLFLNQSINEIEFQNNRSEIIAKYVKIDDIDIYSLLKKFTTSSNFLLNLLANGLINRNLFKIEISTHPIKSNIINERLLNIQEKYDIKNKIARQLILKGNESNQAYITLKDEIKILYKDGSILPLSLGVDYITQTKKITKYFVCYPPMR